MVIWTLQCSYNVTLPPPQRTPYFLQSDLRFRPRALLLESLVFAQADYLFTESLSGCRPGSEGSAIFLAGRKERSTKTDLDDVKNIKISAAPTRQTQTNTECQQLPTHFGVGGKKQVFIVVYTASPSTIIAEGNAINAHCDYSPLYHDEDELRIIE